jgi:hypothetical protein
VLGLQTCTIIPSINICFITKKNKSFCLGDLGWSTFKPVGFFYPFSLRSREAKRLEEEGERKRK